MASTKVLLTGATGFIGGSVLNQILSSGNPKIKELSVTAIVRKEEQVDLLTEHAINARLFNSLDDSKQLREIASEFDIVLHCATGLHTSSAEALILGLGDSQKKTGRQTYYIHTTGTSNLAYSSLSRPDAQIRNWSDADGDVFEGELRRHAEQKYDQRVTDVVVVNTAEKTGVNAYLMMPPTVYGRGLGFFNKQSIQLPFVIRCAIEAGHPEYLGDGSGGVGYVHIEDLAQLYELLLAKVLEGADIPFNRKGIYFSNTGEFVWGDLVKRVGEIGVQLNALKSAEPVHISLDEAERKWERPRLFLETNFAGKSKTTPKVAYALGWKPAHNDKDWDDEIVETWKAVLAQDRKE
ncbi:NAD dependent epimerase/dehydratase [Ilyonectria sp. MPI-CAGE-AT-0026]|nr:NAD dependent epimerase/dehydratase [Ilyonectria sp. MPI-CAGE-AT-0026]